ncbi:hypothetical protein AB0I69_32220 [Streptomyces sp. NPDC050508]|uniref:hypothetical protein n=1 Tax=Streptomyces sp. NPDC050508 TaxID=3155405 RepID=UPI00343AF150
MDAAYTAVVTANGRAAKVPTGEISVTAEIGLAKDATDGGFALTALLRVKLPEHLSINWAHFGLEGLGARHGPTCRAPARPPTSTRRLMRTLEYWPRTSTKRLVHRVHE